MITTFSAFIVFTGIRLTFAEPEGFSTIDPSIPQECYGPPDNANLYECCPITPLFANEDLKECGFDQYAHSKPVDATALCKSRSCIFNKHNLLNDDGSIDYEATGLFFDKWAKNQTNIAQGLVEAKTICFGKKDGPPIPQPPFTAPFILPCDIDKLLVCLKSNIIWRCKHKEHISSCKKLAEHMDECRKYLYKEIPTE